MQRGEREQHWLFPHFGDVTCRETCVFTSLKQQNVFETVLLCPSSISVLFTACQFFYFKFERFFFLFVRLCLCDGGTNEGNGMQRKEREVSTFSCCISIYMFCELCFEAL